MTVLPPIRIPVSKDGQRYTFDNAADCRGCGARIFWYITPRGKRSPHDPDGTSHFATCPMAGRFR